MAFERSPMVKFFSLWETRKKNDDGTEKRFWSGYSGGVRFIMFRCNSTHPQAPMFDVFITKNNPKPGQGGKDKDKPKADTDNYNAAEAAQESNETVTAEIEDPPF